MPIRTTYVKSSAVRQLRLANDNYEVPLGCCALVRDSSASFCDPVRIVLESAGRRGG